MTGAYLSLYSEDRPGLSRGSGAERMCSCPSPGHEDRKPSCSVRLESGKWFCHGCGEGGGVVKWLRLTRGLSGPEALETARRLGLAPERGDARPKSRVNGQRPYRQPTSVENAPLAALPSRYAACYRYRTPDDTEYARVYRYPENRPGRKADPYTLRTDGEHAGTWIHRAPQNRWPYRIESLTGATPVVIVEGEKCADALAGLVEGFWSAELAWRQRRRPAHELGRPVGEGSDPVAGRRRSGPGGDGEAGRRARPDRGGGDPGNRSGRGPSLRLGRGRRHRRGRLGMGADPALPPPCRTGRRGREPPGSDGLPSRSWCRPARSNPIGSTGSGSPICLPEP